MPICSFGGASGRGPSFTIKASKFCEFWSFLRGITINYLADFFLLGGEGARGYPQFRFRRKNGENSVKGRKGVPPIGGVTHTREK